MKEYFTALQYCSWSCRNSTSLCCNVVPIYIQPLGWRKALQRIFLISHFTAAAVKQHCPSCLEVGSPTSACFWADSLWLLTGALEVVGAQLADSSGGPLHHATLMWKEHNGKIFFCGVLFQWQRRKLYN